MTSAVRLNNGGIIEVRTGVLQGIGPVGPRGLQGLTGPEGPGGPQGDTGPQGAIVQYLSKATLTSSPTLTTNTDTLVPFATVAYDDLSVFTSSTNITIVENGDYLVNAWVQFNLPVTAGDSIRRLWLVSSTSGTLAQSACLAVADEPTYVHLSWTHRAIAAEVLNLKARHSDDSSVVLGDGAISVCRVGSGPVGPAGPQGPVGVTGPAGPTGATGATGSSGTG